MKNLWKIAGLTALLNTSCSEEQTSADVTIDRNKLLFRAWAMEDERRGPTVEEFIARKRNCDLDGIKPVDLDDALSTLYTDAGRAYVVRQILDHLKFETWVEVTGGPTSDCVGKAMPLSEKRVKDATIYYFAWCKHPIGLNIGKQALYVTADKESYDYNVFLQIMNTGLECERAVHEYDRYTKEFDPTSTCQSLVQEAEQEGDSYPIAYFMSKIEEREQSKKSKSRRNIRGKHPCPIGLRLRGFEVAGKFVNARNLAYKHSLTEQGHAYEVIAKVLQQKYELW